MWERVWEMTDTDNSGSILTLADGRQIDMSMRADERLVAATREMEAAAERVLWLNDILKANLCVDDTGVVKPITTMSEYDSMHSTMSSLQYKLIDSKSEVLKAMFVRAE